MFPPRRHRLHKLFSTFPDGWPGVGLIILRFVVALNATAQGFSVLTVFNGVAFAWVMGLLAILVAAALLIGFLTPVSGIAATIGYFAMGASDFLTSDVSRHSNVLAALNLAVMSIVLVLLGPGAFSLDARLFGPREIIIPGGRRPLP